MDLEKLALSLAQQGYQQDPASLTGALALLGRARSLKEAVARGEISEGRAYEELLAAWEALSRGFELAGLGGLYEPSRWLPWAYASYTQAGGKEGANLPELVEFYLSLAARAGLREDEIRQGLSDLAAQFAILENVTFGERLWGALSGHLLAQAELAVAARVHPDLQEQAFVDVLIALGNVARQNERLILEDLNSPMPLRVSKALLQLLRGATKEIDQTLLRWEEASRSKTEPVPAEEAVDALLSDFLRSAWYGKTLQSYWEALRPPFAHRSARSPVDVVLGVFDTAMSLWFLYANAVTIPLSLRMMGRSIAHLIRREKPSLELGVSFTTAEPLTLNYTPAFSANSSFAVNVGGVSAAALRLSLAAPWLKELLAGAGLFVAAAFIPPIWYFPISVAMNAMSFKEVWDGACRVAAVPDWRREIESFVHAHPDLSLAELRAKAAVELYPILVQSGVSAVSKALPIVSPKVPEVPPELHPTQTYGIVLDQDWVELLLVSYRDALNRAKKALLSDTVSGLTTSPYCLLSPLSVEAASALYDLGVAKALQEAQALLGAQLGQVVLPEEVLGWAEHAAGSPFSSLAARTIPNKAVAALEGAGVPPACDWVLGGVGEVPVAFRAPKEPFHLTPGLLRLAMELAALEGASFPGQALAAAARVGEGYLADLLPYVEEAFLRFWESEKEKEARCVDPYTGKFVERKRSELSNLEPYLLFLHWFRESYRGLLAQLQGGEG